MADDKKPDTLVDTLLAIVRVALMLIGILGIALEFFRDNGILHQLLGKVFQSTTSFIISLVILGMLYLFNNWLSTSDGKASKKGDVPLYAMMAVGAYFVFRFISTGSI